MELTQGERWIEAFLKFRDSATPAVLQTIYNTDSVEYAQEKFGALQRYPWVWWRSLDDAVRVRLLTYLEFYILEYRS